MAVDLRNPKGDLRTEGPGAGRGRAARRTMWLLLAVALLALPFLSSPGRFVFDTRDPLWFSPTAYLSHALTLWRTTPVLGQEQHDGILFPMAIGVWLLRVAGMSAWAAERLWHGILLFTTAATTILMVDRLRGRRTVPAPLVAGLAYTLTAYVFGYGLQFTPVFLPYVLLPLLLLVVAVGAERRGIVWPALFGLVTFLMGGGNGAPQIYVLLAGWTLLAWLVFVRRSVPVLQGAKFVGWSFVFFFGLNAWWLFLLSSPEVFNALKFSEQPPVINIASSAAESIRGLGFWRFYGGNGFGPWITTVRSFVSSPLLVLCGFVVPVGALLTAWLVRWEHRLYFLLLAVVGVFVAVGIYPVVHQSGFGHALLWAYAHVTGVEGLRTTYKVMAEVNLSLAVLAGVGFEALWVAVRRARRPRPVRIAVVGLVAVVVAANGYPLWTGGLYDSHLGVGAVPAYWQRALAVLDARDTSYRAFFAPGATYARFRWGTIKEGIAATDPRVSSVSPIRLPLSQRYGSNLVAAIEEPYLYGASPRGSAQLFRYLGVRDVVLENDLDWRRSQTASPSQLQTLLGDPGITRTLSFGRPGENVVDGPPVGGSAPGPLPPVEVLSVDRAAQIVRAEGPNPIVVSGDGYGIANAARSEMLPRGVPVLYSGALSPRDLGRVLQDGIPAFIVTDTNRREVWQFSGPRAPHSYTLPANHTIGDAPVGYLLFDDRSSTQSTAVYPGLTSIAASGYGGTFGESPQYRPANAFDGDPATWWVVGTGSNPVGAWIEADLDHPRTLSSISISQPDAWWLREITGVRVTFSDGSSVPALVARGRRTIVRFAPRSTSSVRISVMGASAAPVGSRFAGAALSDVEIPGLHAAELVRAPTDLFDSARRVPGGLDRLARLGMTYLFVRARAAAVGAADEESRIARRFVTAGTRPYALSGTMQLNRSASDADLDSVLLPPGDVTATASSRVFGNPDVRGSAAVDGDPRTEWLAGTGEPQTLAISFPRHTVRHVTVTTDVRPGRAVVTRLLAVFPDGSSIAAGPADPTTGVIRLRFPASRIDGIRLVVESTRGSGRSRYFGISEVRIPGVAEPSHDPNAPLPCTSGAVTIDGRAVPIRAAGTVADLLSGRALPIQTCDGSPVTLGRGSHDLVTSGALQADTIRLAAPSTISAAEPPPAAPAIFSRPGSGGGFEIHVSGATGPYYLVVGQNWDPHWEASIDGRDLGPPTVVDGYSAGWRIDRLGSYEVAVRYGKQSLYTFALGLTAVSLMVVLLIVMAHAWRRRRAPAPDPAGQIRGR